MLTAHTASMAATSGYDTVQFFHSEALVQMSVKRETREHGHAHLNSYYMIHQQPRNHVYTLHKSHLSTLLKTLSRKSSYLAGIVKGENLGNMVNKA